MTDSSDNRVRADDQRARLGAAIRRARGQLSQSALGQLIGEGQTTVSRWEAGDTELELRQALRIERALGLPRGWIAHCAGFVDVDGLIEGGAEVPIRIARLTSYASAVAHLISAATLGLGIRVANGADPSDAGVDGCEIWTVVLYEKPAER